MADGASDVVLISLFMPDPGSTCSAISLAAPPLKSSVASFYKIRGSGARLLVFFFCIAIGVASMVSVRSFTDRLAASTARDARALVAADVRIDTPDLEQPGLRDLLAGRRAADSSQPTDRR